MVNVGVIGVGSLGQHHARIYHELPGVNLAGVFDTSAERAAEIAARHGTRAFDSIEALMEEIDAASVVVPTDRHREVAGHLLEQGIHVLVEKPIASSTAEAEALVAIAERNKLILQVGHVERFNPVMEYLEGVAEHPRFIEAHRLAPYPPPGSGCTRAGPKSVSSST